MAKAAEKQTSRAVMMAGKERAIVMAAHDLFLREGFAGTSMDTIARSAGVSVKTIYSHFANKDELFSKVMLAACRDGLLSGELPPDTVLAERFGWFRETTQHGLMEAGREYLSHLLSEEQVALYRAVTRDAGRFPELGRQYQKNFARGRTGILIAYLAGIAREKGWTARDIAQDAALYESLLRAGLFEEVLHGLRPGNAEEIERQAQAASKTMWGLFTGECL
ncbi:TetR/AcrR family transcriptional regulator [Silvibacterium sp.]|uniref:TetR/AcrR family transcriptional regulator n=1 Tax=Silvibacterium sp. TaxID=1964179 RepID=UPI0039E5CB2A